MGLSVTIFISILSSLVAAGLFLIVLTKMKPNIMISPRISREELEGESLYYQIKILNKTKFDVMRLEAELLAVKEERIGGHQYNTPLYHTKRILLKRPTVLRVRRFDKHDDEADYAFRFVAIDIEQGLERNDQFLFRVYAEHSVSGFGQVFEMRYGQGSIEDGDFVGGDSVDIRPILRPFRRPAHHGYGPKWEYNRIDAIPERSLVDNPKQ